MNREICLSISGHHEETWQPAWGIRTALLAIRSFMEGDAKGQVGGMDAKEEARRDWAVKSRKWRCESCGKTNEELLGEWREVCREKGVQIEDGENPTSSTSSQRDEVPDELRLGYRDELEKGSSERTEGDEDTKGQREEDTPQSAATTADVPTSSPPSAETNLQSSSSAQTTSLSTQTSHTPTSRAAPSPSSPAPQQSPSTTQPPATPPIAATTTNTPAQGAASTSSDGPWLDRAIIGLILALLFMVTRKVVLADED